MKWKYTDSTHTVVYRYLDESTLESRVITDREVADWISQGNTPDDEDPAPPEVYYVSKLTIRRRLRAAGLEDAADAALASVAAKERDWRDAVSILSNDPDVTALLTAIGADTGIILAKE